LGVIVVVVSSVVVVCGGLDMFRGRVLDLLRDGVGRVVSGMVDGGVLMVVWWWRSTKRRGSRWS
jgi:hypothetical protein